MEKKRLLKVVKDPDSFHLDSDDSFLLKNIDGKKENDKHDQIRTQDIKKGIISDQRKQYTPDNNVLFNDSTHLDQPLESVQVQPNDHNQTEDSTLIEDLDYDSLHYSIDYEKSVYVDGARVGKVGQFLKTLVKKTKNFWGSDKKQPEKIETNDRASGLIKDGGRASSEHFTHDQKQYNKNTSQYEEEGAHVNSNSRINLFEGGPRSWKGFTLGLLSKSAEKGKTGTEDKNSHPNGNEDKKNLIGKHVGIGNFIFTRKVVVLVLLMVSLFSLFNNYRLLTTKDLLQTEVSILRRDLHKIIENQPEKEPPSPYDIAKVEKGTKIVNHPTQYTYGLLWRRSGANALSIFSDSFMMPFLMVGQTGSFTFQFSENKTIKSIGILHPEHAKYRSAIKQFQINTDNETIDNFCYENPGNYQEFPLTNLLKTDRITLNVLSNHGNSKCTAIFKIYIFALDDE